MAGQPDAVKQSTPSATTSDRARDWTFYYDGDCGFCTRVVRLMAALDLRRRVRWVAFQSVETLPGGLTAADLQREAFINRRSVLEGGFYSFRRLTLLLPPLWVTTPVMWFPGMNRLGEAVYAWVARNRTRLPGSVCSIDDN
jgi:predicted DCC family thiol-disulfide oxidoreductase YuxK